MLKRTPGPVRAMRLLRYKPYKDGLVAISSSMTLWTSDQLGHAFPWRKYEYAASGDYIGLIYQPRTDALVDFHITANHPNLKTLAWLSRVRDIYLVCAVHRKDVTL